ncbi:hypothetical protein BCV72DRAFT_337436 [Rhizopus microsporus var. microsporus]|uniref:Uncharacterized protein n=2 Tax=Rhizopus microsporus TaxID=58291 RepID=A0A2G4SQ40_RHIZD|nr:uncharacterized protein RHIMIDRAFT_293111 [Rhizopus microsporus ATCC 52813]ORE04237.1 hypothetical protein BCV72DRAFT_337436 [Rhizopus microsporus var. microsporus]PHZ10897.1 hypothetical protein RHIMIDRAFT_293111 [Rhizopus microsporus ATCC 52813]
MTARLLYFSFVLISNWMQWGLTCPIFQGLDALDITVSENILAFTPVLFISIQRAYHKFPFQINYSINSSVDNHYQCSLVDTVPVSPCSNASSSFSERDLSDQYEVFSQLKNVHGNTKDMLNYVANNNNIYIVSLDFAGLSTNVSDLKEFVR